MVCYAIVDANPPADYELEYKPSIVQCIDQKISEYTQESGLKVRYGIASYWHARLTNEFSDLDIQLVPASKSLSPFTHTMSKDIFRDTYDFAVVPHGQPDFHMVSRQIIERINGKPKRVYECANNATLLIYGPGKVKLLTEKIKIRKAGDQYTWLACELPTVIGEQTNDCEMRTPIGSKSGFLSYGPYERIPAGTYRFSISYSIQ